MKTNGPARNLSSSPVRPRIGGPPVVAAIAARWRAWLALSMASETEALAVQLVRALYDATDGRPRQGRMIERLDGATADAVEFAAARGWVQVDGGHSITLTEAGRQLAKDLGRI